MDAKKFLDELLGAGQDLGARSRDYAEQKLDLPPEGEERDAMLSGMGKGAAVAGALALLLGTKTGRKLGGKAVKLGSLAALGGVAYKAYQSWQEQGTSAATAQAAPAVPVNQDTPANVDQRSLRLLRAMIGAARADGHIDNTERARINEQVVALGLDASAAEFIQQELEKPLNPIEIALGVSGPEEAAEVYLASLTILNIDNPMEGAYLQHLATALGLDSTLVAQIHEQLDGQNG